MQNALIKNMFLFNQYHLALELIWILEVYEYI